MAMSVSPGGRSSPGFCHIPSQRNRPAQKQIICPIYRGLGANAPYRQGLEPKKLGRITIQENAQGVIPTSFFKRRANPDSFSPFRSLPAEPIRRRNWHYSAAADVGTNCSLVFAADNMKSEILGTISERNRDPLNTP